MNKPDVLAEAHQYEVQLLLDEAAVQGLPDEASLTQACTLALQQQSRLDLTEADTVEISIQLLDTQQMRTLNHTHRNKDSATNVLSFESGLPLLRNEHSHALQALGDLVFCPELIAREAQEQGKSSADHWAHLAVHGTLHLCGYDHIDTSDASRMELLEVQILASFGISNPYLMHSLQ